ncbi:MAG: hypothetical protein OXC42_00075 [Gammaproteobacteria bacterium]|nr:hypothetical protein [Gammaproteobacteria bacterium]
MSRILMPRDRTQKDDLNFTLAELFELVPELGEAWKTLREARPENSAKAILASLISGLAQDTSKGEFLSIDQILALQNQIASNTLSQYTGERITAWFDTEGKLHHETLPDKTN